LVLPEDFFHGKSGADSRTEKSYQGKGSCPETEDRMHGCRFRESARKERLEERITNECVEYREGHTAIRKGNTYIMVAKETPDSEAPIPYRMQEYEDRTWRVVSSNDRWQELTQLSHWNGPKDIP